MPLPALVMLNANDQDFFGSQIVVKQNDPATEILLR